MDSVGADSSPYSLTLAARGQAQAIINDATAEAANIKEVRARK